MTKDDQVKAIAESIYKYLMDKNQAGFLPKIIEILKDKYVNKIVDVLIETTIEPTADQKREMEGYVCQYLGRTDIEIRYMVNPSLTGGIKVSIGDKVLDMSVRAKINKLYDA